jgi:hypothetical protein
MLLTINHCAGLLQVLEAKAVWEAKENKLTAEKNEALRKAVDADAKLRQMDDAFRLQLDAVETSHRMQIADLASRKQAEIDAAVRRTSEVEEEMRILLNETDAYRRTMDERLKKLTTALQEFGLDVARTV